MDAVIMTGGKGTRLLPFTKHLPKGLMPVGGAPLLGHLVQQLQAAGFHRITMCCGYLAPLIQSYFQDGSQWGVDIRYVLEQEPLGTIGALAKVTDLNRSFLVINCDVLTTLDFRAFAAFHEAGKSVLTIASQEKSIQIQLGVLKVSQDSVVSFAEKPDHNVRVSMGIYMMTPDVLKYIPSHQQFDVPDLIGTLLAQHLSVRHYANDAYWMDVGTRDEYTRACEEYDQMAHLIHKKRGEQA